MNGPDKIVLEHAGALGDFLLAWPALAALAQHFADRPVHMAVRPAHAHWLAPLATPCLPDLRRALDARFAGDRWPEALDRVLVVRPGLAKRPDLPESPNFWVLQGIEEGGCRSPRQLYGEALAARGIPLLDKPEVLFRMFFGGHAPDGRTVLLFPGAGHQDKAWPLDRMERLAEHLGQRGLRPFFVLGPAEMERGTVPAVGDSVRLENLEKLSRFLAPGSIRGRPGLRSVASGRLARGPGACALRPHRVPAMGAEGMSVLTAGLACAPCTVMTSGEFAPDCPRPLPCLAGITVEAVMERLAPWLP
jgi:hypothetical protein